MITKANAAVAAAPPEQMLLNHHSERLHVDCNQLVYSLARPRSRPLRVAMYCLALKMLNPRSCGVAFMLLVHFIQLIEHLISFRAAPRFHPTPNKLMSSTHPSKQALAYELMSELAIISL
jgi:hypothetical protein